MGNNGITDALASYAAEMSYEKLDAETIQVQKYSLLDAIACMAAATGVEGDWNRFAEFALTQGSGNCSMIGRKEKVSPAMAALANGALMHALDFEDSHEGGTVHPNSASVPMMMALVQSCDRDISGKQFLTALVTSSDVCCRIAMGVDGDLLKYGWNMPAIHESLGAAMGGGQLLGLTKDQILDALALAISQTTASANAFMSKASTIRTVRDGFAAQAALQSVLLAKLGIAAKFDDALESRFGYYHAYARDQYTPSRVTEGLGTVFQSAFLGFKPWPCCRATHTTLDGIRELMSRNHLTADDIQSVDVKLYEIGRMTMEPKEAKYRPQSSAIAKVSLPYAAALMMLYGDVRMEHYTEPYLHDPEVLANADKLTCEIIGDHTTEQKKTSSVAMKTKRGEVYEIIVEHALGAPEKPLTERDMRNKFESCLKAASKEYTEDQIQEIFHGIMEIESITNVQRLLDLL